MSARSRSAPWYKPSRAVIRLRWWKLCSDWSLEQGNKHLLAATRAATVMDIPEERVMRVLQSR